MAEAPTPKKVGHFTVSEKGPRTWIDCEKCGIGMEAKGFGPIPRDVMIDTFVKQHAHAPKKARARRG
jgi:hypothetical protein